MKLIIAAFFFSICLSAEAQSYSDYYPEERPHYEDDRNTSPSSQTTSPSRDSEEVRDTRNTSGDGTYRSDSENRSYTRTSEGRYIRDDNYVCYGEENLRCYPGPLFNDFTEDLIPETFESVQTVL